MSYKLGDRSLKRLHGVNQILIDCASRALLESSYDMTIPWMGGLRTAEEQKHLFEQGNSKADGYIKKSYHQSGNALDIIPVVDGYENTRGFNNFAQCMYNAWTEMAKEGLTGDYSLAWGGFFGSDGWDKPHWQIVKR